MQMPQRFSQSQFEKTTTYSNGTVITEDFKIDTFEYRYCILFKNAFVGVEFCGLQAT